MKFRKLWPTTVSGSWPRISLHAASGRAGGYWGTPWTGGFALNHPGGSNAGCEDRRRIVERVRNERGALDILINNAGIIEGGPLETFDDDALARTFQTNVMAPMALTRDLVPLLIAAKPSRVVNVGSIFGDIGYPGFTCYSAAKFALRGFSIALRREWKQKGIGVNYVAPRATRTDAAVAFADLIAKTKMNTD